MTATQVLEREHRVIQKVAASLVLMAEDLKAGKPVATEVLRDIAQFLMVFAEKCHQQKEETYLFPILLKKGVRPAVAP